MLISQTDENWGGKWTWKNLSTIVSYFFSPEKTTWKIMIPLFDKEGNLN